MSDRREFLKKSGSLALGSLLITRQMQSAFAGPLKYPAGLQLYTLFSTLEDDFSGTLKKVAAIGYKEIESAFSKKTGFYGLKPQEFATMVKDLGMSWKSHHVIGAPFKPSPGMKLPTDANGKPITIPPMRNLRENMQELVDDAAAGGVEYLVCAGTPIETMEEIRQSIDTLNKTSEAAKKAGLIMAYHNHDREFKTVDGKLPYDLLLSETDPDLLKMELDLCWVTKAGVDPIELFQKHQGRFHLWHVKDIDKNLQGPQPVGTGIIDFKRIFANAGLSGMKHFFVEHDQPADAMASITTSFNNLQKIMS